MKPFIKRSLGRRGPNVDGVTYLEWCVEKNQNKRFEGDGFVSLDIIATPMLKIGDERIKVGLDFVSTVTITEEALENGLKPKGLCDLFLLFDSICADFEASREKA